MTSRAYSRFGLFLVGLLLAACPPEELKPDGGVVDAGVDAGEVTEDPCASVRCEAGSHCEQIEVECIQAPCPPQAACVPDAPVVPKGCELDCEQGWICQITAEGPACVDPSAAGVPCGPVTCAANLECCNESCGICTEPGGACTEQACEPEPPKCDLQCDGGTHCELVEVTCVTEPCLPVPQCVKDRNPCETVKCSADTHCEAHADGTAGCVPNEDLPAACAALLCPIGTYCDASSGQAKCVRFPSCRRMECDPGYHCELEAVQCIRAPCPAQPRCVADDPCKVLRCDGTCEVKEGKARCITPSVPCGKNKCSGGQVCCNASCGICTEPGRFCYQIACER